MNKEQIYDMDRIHELALKLAGQLIAQRHPGQLDRARGTAVELLEAISTLKKSQEPPKIKTAI
jgi:hypothetical protein